MSVPATAHSSATAPIFAGISASRKIRNSLATVLVTAAVSVGLTVALMLAFTTTTGSTPVGHLTADPVLCDQLANATGSPAAQPMGGRPGVSKLDGERAWLLARLAEKPDLTLHALLAELRGRGVTVSCDTLWRFLRSAGISFKKNRVRQRAGSA